MAVGILAEFNPFHACGIIIVDPLQQSMKTSWHDRRRDTDLSKAQFKAKVFELL